MPIMAMTTKSSTSVKPCSRHRAVGSRFFLAAVLRALTAEVHPVLTGSADGTRSVPATLLRPPARGLSGRTEKKVANEVSQPDETGVDAPTHSLASLPGSALHYKRRADFHNQSPAQSALASAHGRAAWCYTVGWFGRSIGNSVAPPLAISLSPCAVRVVFAGDIGCRHGGTDLVAPGQEFVVHFARLLRLLRR